MTAPRPIPNAETGPKAGATSQDLTPALSERGGGARGRTSPTLRATEAFLRARYRVRADDPECGLICIAIAVFCFVYFGGQLLRSAF